MPTPNRVSWEPYCGYIAEHVKHTIFRLIPHRMLGAEVRKPPTSTNAGVLKIFLLKQEKKSVSVRNESGRKTCSPPPSLTDLVLYI